MPRPFSRFMVVLAVCVTLVACGGGGDSPTGISIPTAPPVSGANTGTNTNPTPVPAQQIAGIGICAGKEMYQSADGTLKFCVLETNLELLDNRCQPVTTSGTYFVVWGIISSTEGYLRAAGFHSPENSCGATGDGLFNDPNDRLTFAASADGVRFRTSWDVNADSCGRNQNDGKFKNATSEVDWPFGVVFNFPIACPTCDGIKLELNKTQSGRTVTISPTWKNGGRATLNWGDGTPVITGIRTGETYSHTYSGEGPYTLSFDVAQGGLVCPDPITIRFTPEPTPTPSPTPSPSPTPTPEPCTGAGEPTFSFTKSESATTGTVTSVLTFNAGFVGSISLAPSPVSGFSGGSVTSGAPNNSMYNRPAPDQSALIVNATWQVTQGELVCRSGSGSVSITPQPPVERTCADVNANVSCAPSGTSASCAVSWNNPGSGQIKLDSGSYAAIANGSSANYTSLSAGSHTATLKVQDGNLYCTDPDTFSIQPPVCQPVHMDQEDGCYKPNPWGNGNNPADVCGYFGLVPTFKDEVSNGGTSWTLTHSATMAVAHWGGADCSQGAQAYQFINPATTGQVITSPGRGGISFVQYCGCPTQQSYQYTRP